MVSLYPHFTVNSGNYRCTYCGSKRPEVLDRLLEMGPVQLCDRARDAIVELEYAPIMYKEKAMTAEQNKVLVRRFFEEVFNKVAQRAAAEIIPPNSIAPHPAFPDLIRGPEGIMQMTRMFHA